MTEIKKFRGQGNGPRRNKKLEEEVVNEVNELLDVFQNHLATPKGVATKFLEKSCILCVIPEKVLEKLLKKFD